VVAAMLVVVWMLLLLLLLMMMMMTESLTVPESLASTLTTISQSEGSLLFKRCRSL
jgi:hypothetical protein